jgi:hypothetical protein
MPNAVFMSTKPTLTWAPYSFEKDPAYPGSEAPVTTEMDVGGALGINGPLIVKDCLSGDATSWVYNSGWACSDGLQLAELYPGYSYTAEVTITSTGHQFGSTLGAIGWYYEIAGSDGGHLLVATDPHLPVFDYLTMSRGVSLYPDGRKVYGEYCSVLGTNPDGARYLQFEFQEPSKQFSGTIRPSPDAEGLQAWQGYQADSLASLKQVTGQYHVVLTNKAARTGTDEVAFSWTPKLPVVVPTITSPRDGGVTGTNPTFRWVRPPGQCTAQLWVEEIPSDGAGCLYVWSPWCAVTTFPDFPDARIVWCRGNSADDCHALARVNSLPYGDGTCHEDLQSGHRYRLHVMVNANEGNAVNPLYPGVLPEGTISQAMVDFTVR